MRKQNNDMYQNAMKVAKRIAITIICCVPVMIAFGYLTHKHIKGAWQIICFMLIMTVAVVIVELIAKRQAQKREAKKILYQDKDVFK